VPVVSLSSRNAKLLQESGKSVVWKAVVQSQLYSLQFCYYQLFLGMILLNLTCNLFSNLTTYTVCMLVIVVAQAAIEVALICSI
jgi:hypothetical protein